MAERKQKKMCQSLRSILELMAKLNENKDVMKKVLQNIKGEIKNYMQYTEESFASSDFSKGSLVITIEQCAELLKMLVGDGNKYEIYNTNLLENKVEEYVETLVNNIFAVYVSISFLVFMCSTEFENVGGGHWNEHYLNGKTMTDQNLYHWLIDKDRKANNDRILRRGFKRGPKSTYFFKGSEIVADDSYFRFGTPYGSLILLIGDKVPGMMHFALQYMVFIGTWSPSKCGNAVVFLDAFCFKVIGRLFHNVDMEKNIDTLIDPCEKLSGSIKSLLQQLGADNGLPQSFYTYCLHYRSPSTYVTWLKKHIPKLIKSLGKMSEDCKNWSQEKLKDGRTQGPFPWGFTFTSRWENNMVQRLQECIAEVTNALNKLKEAIRKSYPNIREEVDKDTESQCEEDYEGNEENHLPQEQIQEHHPDTKTHIVLSPAAKTGVTSGIIGAGAIGAAGYVIYSHAATAKNLVFGLFSCFVK